MKIHSYGFEPGLQVEYLICESPDCERCNRDVCLADAGQIELLADIRVRIPGYGILAIKKGFKWDGASIPRFFWRATYHPLHHRIIIASLVHDILYASELLGRAVADWIFVCVCEAWGVGWAKRNEMYLAVRSCGFSVWSDHTPQSIEAARELVELIPEGE